MRIGFKSTIEDDLPSNLKIEAVKNKVNVNDISEELIKKFSAGEIKLEAVDK